MTYTQTQEYNQMMLRKYMEEIKADQNLSMGILGGAAAAIVGAVIWGVITYVTGYQFGWVAVGVGFLVGCAVRQAGRGIDTQFGVSGAILALAGCLMGNLFTVCIAISQQAEVGLMEVLGGLDWPLIIDIYKETFTPMDLLFYGIAVYEGYRFSFRKITEQEIAAIMK